ncbi:hypothetical protein ACFSQQ_14690 [Mesorhizobium kowhaii]|uniref:hypothetical protein n=1 Tax=Mesorhizobium kowhaii TaxID=1300272 RepID=UPI0035E85780
MNRIETLKSRWRPEWSERSDLAKLNGSFQKSLHFIESLPTHRAKISGPGTLSPKGINETVRAAAAKDIVPDLRRASWEAEKATNSIKNQKLALAVPKPDKTDIAGAILRQEIRTMLRGLDHGDRVRLVMTDPEFLAASFEGPAALSGMTPEFRADLQRRMIEEKHGPAIEAMKETEEAIAVATAAIEMAVGTVRTECGFGDGPDFQFDRWMATASAAVEQEIAAEKAKMEKPATTEIVTRSSGKDLASDIDKMFAGLETYQFIDGKLTSVETQAAA